jgi:hemolysin-activating ACP:hemolysin acyltransferase
MAKVGDDFGKLSKVVDNPNITPDWSITSAHGTERMAQRGVTQDMVNKWMSEGKVLEQTSGNYIYISKEGVAVFGKSRKMITTYSSKYFDENMWNIVRQVLGE